jgi:hypothetical protein
LEYELNTGASFGIVNYTDCNGVAAQIYIDPNDTQYICACEGSPVGYGDITITESGPYC